MTHRQCRNSVVAMLGIVVPCCAVGCQYSYPYALRGVIKSAEGGAPLAGVSISLKADGIFGKEKFPIVTEADGTFGVDYEVMDIQFMRAELPTWALVLSKEGYSDEIIDISPTRKPDSPKTTTHIVVVAYMKAKK
jgi:hypothetical protein